ncbi:unnamed protein product, partial [Brachionus calyciflorus]
MPEFELVRLFLEALNPRVRAELESKNVDTLKEAVSEEMEFTQIQKRTWEPECKVKGKFDKKWTKRVNFVEEFKDGDLDKCKMEYVYTCNSSDLLSVSGSKFVKKYGLNLNDSRIKIKTANNSISKVDGKTDSLKVDIDGHVCDLEFLVIDHEDNDGLLGLDWFKRTGASLHPSIKSLKFPSKIVLLDTLEMENCNKDVTEILSDEVFPID